MVGVTYTLDDELARAALERIGRAAANPEGAMHALGAHFVFSTQRNIEQERAPSGQPWPRLSPRTANTRLGKGRRGYGHMLRVTNRLYSSISYLAAASSVEWGSNLVYAGAHQDGALIDVAPRQGAVNLRRVRTGGGIRTRFARRGAKGAAERVVSIRGHQIRIPARPYLGISAFDRERVPQIVTDYLEREAKP